MRDMRDMREDLLLWEEFFTEIGVSLQPTFLTYVETLKRVSSLQLKPSFSSSSPSDAYCLIASLGASLREEEMERAKRKEKKVGEENREGKTKKEIREIFQNHRLLPSLSGQWISITKSEREEEEFGVEQEIEEQEESEEEEREEEFGEVALLDDWPALSSLLKQQQEIHILSPRQHFVHWPHRHASQSHTSTNGFKQIEEEEEEEKRRREKREKEKNIDYFLREVLGIRGISESIYMEGETRERERGRGWMREISREIGAAFPSFQIYLKNFFPKRYWLLQNSSFWQVFFLSCLSSFLCCCVFVLLIVFFFLISLLEKN